MFFEPYKRVRYLYFQQIFCSTFERLDIIPKSFFPKNSGPTTLNQDKRTLCLRDLLPKGSYDKILVFFLRNIKFIHFIFRREEPTI